jgi:hypothetical protein
MGWPFKKVFLKIILYGFFGLVEVRGDLVQYHAAFFFHAHLRGRWSGTGYPQTDLPRAPGAVLSSEACMQVYSLVV